MKAAPRSRVLTFPTQPIETAQERADREAWEGLVASWWLLPHNSKGACIEGRDPDAAAELHQRVKAVKQQIQALEKQINGMIDETFIEVFGRPSQASIRRAREEQKAREREWRREIDGGLKW